MVDAESGALQQAFHDPRVGRIFLADVRADAFRPLWSRPALHLRNPGVDVRVAVFQGENHVHQMEFPARFQHSGESLQSLLLPKVRQMVQRQAGVDRVEQRSFMDVGQKAARSARDVRQPLFLRLPFHVIQHRGGDVDGDHGGATARGLARERARSAAEVRHDLAGFRIQALEDRRVLPVDVPELPVPFLVGRHDLSVAKVEIDGRGLVPLPA